MYLKMDKRIEKIEGQLRAGSASSTKGNWVEYSEERSLGVPLGTAPHSMDTQNQGTSEVVKQPTSIAHLPPPPRGWDPVRLCTKCVPRQ